MSSLEKFAVAVEVPDTDDCDAYTENSDETNYHSDDAIDHSKHQRSMRPTYSMRSSSAPQNSRVAIIGSGWIGRALAKRFADANIDVVIGCRNPLKSLESRFEICCGFSTIQEACRSSNVIILAIPIKAYDAMIPILRVEGNEKIVIDCSNRVFDPKVLLSAAEEFQSKVPGCFVVKAFNETSAYELSMGGMGAPEKVTRYCCDDEASKTVIAALLHRMGIPSRDVGMLKHARMLEAQPYKFFKEWKSAFLVAFPVFLVLVVTCPLWYAGSNSYSFSTCFVKMSGRFSLILFGLVYMAGNVAAIYQLVQGNARTCFPGWLTEWLTIRKHLGLLALWFAFHHTILVCFLQQPIDLIDMGLDGNGRSMNRWGEASILFGDLSLLVFSILGICSIPSVGARLSWREWSFIQSTLGYAGLILGLIHVLFIGVMQLCSDHRLECSHFNFMHILHEIRAMKGNYPSIAWIISGLILLVIMMKGILSIPPISWRLANIRDGNEEKYTISWTDLKKRNPNTSE